MQFSVRSSKNISAENPSKNLPLGNPPKKNVSSILIFSFLSVFITLLCAGAALAVTKAILIGQFFTENFDWIIFNFFKNPLNGPGFIREYHCVCIETNS